MPVLLDLQRGMRDRSLDREPRHPVVDALLDNHPLSPADRLNIHRHTTMQGLTAVLADAFPVVARLVGDLFFARAAADFIRAHPPRVAPLLFFGNEFPGFLGDYAPAASVPYLADMARLEAAWNFAYNAAEQEPLDPASLLSFAEEDLGGLILEPHPSLRFVASSFPLLSLWDAHQPGAPEDFRIDPQAGGVTLLVFRPDAEVIIRATSPASFAFQMALSARQPIATAWETALSVDPDFQLDSELGALLGARLFVGARLS